MLSGSHSQYGNYSAATKLQFKLLLLPHIFEMIFKTVKVCKLVEPTYIDLLLNVHATKKIALPS